MGAGGLGLMAIGMLRALGHERIVAVDVDPAKFAAAKAAGAQASRSMGAMRMPPSKSRKSPAARSTARSIWSTTPALPRSRWPRCAKAAS